MIRQICLLFLFLGIPIQQRTPLPTSRAAARVSITGTVVRGGTNEPIGSVRLTLRPSGVSAVTDMGGKFRIDAVPGRYTLTAEREGFVLQLDATHGVTEMGVALTLNAGQPISGMALAMIPAPTISGHTYFPNGEPLAAAVVQAYRWRYTPFGRRMKIVKTALTDDSGEYRLFRLTFGEYIVSASYSHRSQRSALNGRQLSANVPDPDEGYTTVFYGGAASASEAQVVRVAPGLDAGGLNIILSDTPRFSIRGQVVSAVPLPPDLKIAFVPEGSDLNLHTSNFISVSADGTFEVTGVSPGSYLMLAFGGRLSSPLVPVHVGNSNVEKLSIPLAPAITVNGRVSIEGAIRPNLAGTNLAGVKIGLVRRSREIEQRIEVFAGGDGAFTLPDVGPGEYDVLVERVPSGTYTRSIRYGGRDVLSDAVRIGIDPNDSLDVSLSPMTGTVEGHVSERVDVPSPGVQVVLVPEMRLRRRPDRYIVGLTDVSGNFQLTGVPPGQYTAFAFEQIEPEAYYAFAYDPSVSARFADRAASVNLNQGNVTRLELKAIPSAETAGGFR